MKKLILTLALEFLALLLSYSVLAQNTVPNPPHNLQAAAEELSDGTFNVKLSWFISQNFYNLFPEGFRLYQTEFQNGIAKKSPIAELKAQQNQYQYYYVVSNLQPGIYEFYATAFIGKSESKPSNSVRVELVKSHPFIKIISQPPIYAYVGKSYVYQLKAYSNINCPIDIFGFEGTPPEGMTISKNGLIEWVPKASGEYLVTVVVGTTCKINVQPAKQTFKITVLPQQPNDKPYVRIVSQPPTKGTVGVPIKYQVIAESNIRCPIKFKITNSNAEDAVIDENTGLLTWTPNKPGQFEIVIFAYLTCDTNVVTHQRLFIVVQDFNPPQKHCIHINGIAKFDDDTPVPNGFVYAWKLDAQDNQTNVVFRTFIKNGAFEFYLPEGTYVFEFWGDLFGNRFYIDATKFNNATRVKLQCSHNQITEQTIEMVLTKKPQPKLYNVSGFVKSAKDDSPIFAVVEFIPVEFLNNPDKKANYGINTNFVTKTDKNGFYQIQLPNSFTYIAHAIPYYNKSEFFDQYYYLSTSPYLADIIELSSDKDDINFLLEPIEKPNNGFTGIVIDKDRNPVQSRVMAILLRSSQPNVPPRDVSVRIVDTDSNGLFTFSNLTPGDYVLLSIPKDKQYAPGYYKINDFATLKWKEATIISVDQSMIQMIFEIKHRNRSGWKGLVRFEGKVFESTGLIKQTIEPPCENGKIVQEALVCALDQNGNVIDYYITGYDGKFILETLPPTTFRILITKVGYKDTEATFNGDYESNFELNTDIFLEKEVSKVSEESNYRIIQTGQMLVVIFENVINPQNVQIFDIFGNSLPTTYTQTEYSISTDISQFSAGIYFARITTLNRTYSIKFTIVR